MMEPWVGWYHEPGTLLEMGVADAAAGASELGTVKDIGTLVRLGERLKAVRSRCGE